MSTKMTKLWSWVIINSKMTLWKIKKFVENFITYHSPLFMERHCCQNYWYLGGHLMLWQLEGFGEGEFNREIEGESESLGRWFIRVREGYQRDRKGAAWKHISFWVFNNYFLYMVTLLTSFHIFVFALLGPDC